MSNWTAPSRLEPPPAGVSVAPTAPPPRLDHHEKMKVRAAAFRATRIYPGAVGELLARELLSLEEFGFRFDKHGLTARLVDEIMKAPLEPK